MREGMPLKAGTNYMEDGARVYVQMILPPWEGVVLSDTEEHETIHAVVGEKVHEGVVEEVSTIPGPGYLGYTQMSFMTAEAAIAPDAFAMRGTHHDRGLVARMRVNAGAAAAVARKIVGESREEIQSVGFELKKKRLLKGHEVRNAMARVNGDKKAEVTIFSADGSYKTATKDVLKGGIVFIGEEELSIAA